MEFKLKTYATDGIDSLSLKDKLEILASKSPVMTIILKVNFNPDNPSSHNIYQDELESGNTKVYSDGEWVELNTNYVMHKVIKSKIIDLVMIFCELKAYLRDKTRIKLEKYFSGAYADFQVRKCDREPASILKKDMTIAFIKKDLHRRSEGYIEKLVHRQVKS
jgi:hypothetical protein